MNDCYVISRCIIFLPVSYVIVIKKSFSAHRPQGNLFRIIILTILATCILEFTSRVLTIVMYNLLLTTIYLLKYYKSCNTYFQLKKLIVQKLELSINWLTSLIMFCWVFCCCISFEIIKEFADFFSLKTPYLSKIL